jgi:lipid-A-disaccharide synthase-like uncharacterized protein
VTAAHLAQSLALAGAERSIGVLLEKIKNPFALLGLAGQAVFFTRFLVKWIASERAGRSLIPLGFWYLSIAGGMMVLLYGLYIWDPVVILGQTTGVLVYGRNLVLVHRERRRLAEAKTADLVAPEAGRCS